MAGPFDLEGFFMAIDAKRQKQNISWSTLARQVGVSTSTIRRFAVAEDAEADGVLTVLRWLGVPAEAFVDGSEGAEAVLNRSHRGYDRVDMSLVAKAQGNPPGVHRRTRTTIQRLVELAQQSGQPVASLTRTSQT